MAYIRRNSGLIVPSDEAISGGLSFAMAFQNGPRSAFMTRGAVATQEYAGSKPGVLGPGIACVGPANPLGWGGTSTSNTYSVSTTQGTMLAYVVADHASNAVTHNRTIVLLGDTTGYPNTPSISLQNAAGGNWYCGWIYSGENRIVTSSASSYVSGDVLTVAITWNAASGQRLYVKGAQIATNAWASYVSTAGSQVNINGLDGAVWPWADSDNGGVLFVVIYDRELSAQEIAAAEADPWWWTDRTPLVRRVFGGASTGVSVSLAGSSVTASAGTVAPGLSIPASGSAATSAAGTLTSALAASLSGSAGTGALGTVAPGIGMTLTGAALTVSSGTLAYSIGFTLTGVSSATAGGTISSSGGDTETERALTGISMSALPGNVRVTGGTRWVPQEARVATVATSAGNTMPPPPRLTGDAQTDIRAQQQYLQTFYDQFVKINNVLGRINDHETRIAALEEDT